MFKKAIILTHPAPARQDAPFLGRGRSKAHAATNKEQPVCALRRGPRRAE